jgi:hypothetical protein
MDAVRRRHSDVKIKSAILKKGWRYAHKGNKSYYLPDLHVSKLRRMKVN